MLLINTLLLLIAIGVLLFSFSIIKKIETRDIYNGPHPNRASRDGITNLWDLQLAPPHLQHLLFVSGAERTGTLRAMERDAGEDSARRGKMSSIA